MKTSILYDDVSRGRRRKRVLDHVKATPRKAPRRQHLFTLLTPVSYTHLTLPTTPYV